MSDKEIQALISLLQDSDENVLQIVKGNLLDKGIDIIPDLEHAWETTLNEEYQQRIEDIIQNIHFKSIKQELKEWINSPMNDLMQGAYLIAKHQYPDLKYADIQLKIEEIYKDVKDEICDNITPLEKIRVLNHVIYDIHQFTRNTSNFYSPQNSYINLVLELKKGNSVTLGILYIYIAQKLHIPVFGVNLPKNFILCYNVNSNTNSVNNPKNDILFYINPFNKGAVLGSKEIDYFVRQQQLNRDEAFYEPCTNLQIIERLLVNLIDAYHRLGYPEKISELSKLYELLH